MNKSLSKSFFLISFLPALAYWYLEANYPIKIAVAGGLGLALLEMLLEYIFCKHIHTVSKANFFLILLLGGLSFLGEEGIWFKLQPCITGIAIAAFMAYRMKVGRGLLVEFLADLPLKNKPPEFFVHIMEKHLTIYFFVTGVFMGYVAIYMTTDQWLFFKTIGTYIMFGVFYVFELVWLRKVAKDYARMQRQKEVLSNFKP